MKVISKYPVIIAWLCSLNHWNGGEAHPEDNPSYPCSIEQEDCPHDETHRWSMSYSFSQPCGEFSTGSTSIFWSYSFSSDHFSSQDFLVPSSSPTAEPFSSDGSFQFISDFPTLKPTFSSNVTTEKLMQDQLPTELPSVVSTELEPTQIQLPTSIAREPTIQPPSQPLKEETFNPTSFPTAMTPSSNLQVTFPSSLPTRVSISSKSPSVSPAAFESVAPTAIASSFVPTDILSSEQSLAPTSSSVGSSTVSESPTAVGEGSLPHFAVVPTSHPSSQPSQSSSLVVESSPAPSIIPSCNWDHSAMPSTTIDTSSDNSLTPSVLTDFPVTASPNSADIQSSLEPTIQPTGADTSGPSTLPPTTMDSTAPSLSPPTGSLQISSSSGPTSSPSISNQWSGVPTISASTISPSIGVVSSIPSTETISSPPSSDSPTILADLNGSSVTESPIMPTISPTTFSWQTSQPSLMLVTTNEPTILSSTNQVVSSPTIMNGTDSPTTTTTSTMLPSIVIINLSISVKNLPPAVSDPNFVILKGLIDKFLRNIVDIPIISIGIEVTDMSSVNTMTIHHRETTVKSLSSDMLLISIGITSNLSVDPTKYEELLRQLLQTPKVHALWSQYASDTPYSATVFSSTYTASITTLQPTLQPTISPSADTSSFNVDTSNSQFNFFTNNKILVGFLCGSLVLVLGALSYGLLRSRQRLFPTKTTVCSEDDHHDKEQGLDSDTFSNNKHDADDSSWLELPEERKVMTSNLIDDIEAGDLSSSKSKTIEDGRDHFESPTL